MEKVKDGVGGAYARMIESASFEDFKPFFNTYISEDAHVITDEWSGCIPLKKEYKHLKRIPSDEGKNFPDLHIPL